MEFGIGMELYKHTIYSYSTNDKVSDTLVGSGTINVSHNELAKIST
jgi:hypothetical protein